MMLAALAKEDWDNATPEQVQEAVASAATNGTPIVIMESEDGPGTPYAFKTREGVLGIVQVTGVSEDPRGVKVRYKLLKGSSTTGNSDDLYARLQAAKTIFANPGRDNALTALA